MKRSSQTVEPQHDDVDGSGRLRRDQGGFVLPWMALMLLVLIAMAGFGVDVWNWWYTSQKVQRAADAGALAGVPFMPGNLNSNPPSAASTAVAVVKQNGYTITAANVAQGPKVNQLVVTVSDTVNNYFTSLLGLQTTTITRSATSEFNAPVQMGSPVGHLANDPENGASDKHWLNIGAPGINKQTGDRFADFANCSGAYGCSGGNNGEYSEGTYVYTVDVPSISGSGVDIQVYDPEYANGGGGSASCTVNWLTGAQMTTLQGPAPNNYADAPTRFAGGNNDYCTGDDDTHTGSSFTPQATAWLVRDHSISQFQPLQNPVISGCAHQFNGYQPVGTANAASYWFDLLDKRNSTGRFDLDFSKSFHRWYTLCHVTQPGRYFIQVRSNVPYNAGLRNDPTYLTKSEYPTPEDTSIAGQNRYSLRAVNGGTGTVTPGASTYALERLPVYTNVTGSSTPNFYLARLLPGGGSTGRILQLEFYDIGDLSSGTTTTLQVIPPVDAGGSPITCSQWIFNGTASNAPPSGATFSGCTLTGITSAAYPSGFNGVLVDVKVNVPGNYTCGNAPYAGVNDPNACWFKIRMSYSGGTPVSNDTTTWTARIGGDPVRLVK